ncbi:hypothetical protein [Shumkonia mesophila]|uniref:hypothetical protein n=1 Tax=Shumkonia mesophila TaxID=2838854 RepID=UPI002935130E|nr:hypothetical protein [Shumkonia mesophila]
MDVAMGVLLCAAGCRQPGIRSGGETIQRRRIVDQHLAEAAQQRRLFTDNAAALYGFALA